MRQSYLRRSLSTRFSRTLVSGVFLGVSISAYTRHWRNQQLRELKYYTATDPSSLQVLPRTTDEILRVVERSGLMGRPGAKSVKEDLEYIRRWHIERGYKGGLVLRELLQPLFTPQDHKKGLGDFEEYENAASNDTTFEDLANLNLARRECYYLYYEIAPNGEIKHEIFCRGTTLSIDMWTSLTVWMEFDDELGCSVHRGFNRRANHILEDILPLMAAPGPRTTVRVSGHSLGGAVSYLLAAKLKLRGYRVIEVTGVAAPRVCPSAASAARLQSFLPKNTIRIENDTDPVPLLPPFGHSVGNKLYLVDSISKAVYLPLSEVTRDKKWVDNGFVNARVWEILSTKARAHRIPYIVSQLKQALREN